ncbi:hypothetical protein JCM8097_005019 [Rhodosporidiobolus ruineniae]
MAAVLPPPTHLSLEPTWSPASSSAKNNALELTLDLDACSSALALYSRLASLPPSPRPSARRLHHHHDRQLDLARLDVYEIPWLSSSDDELERDDVEEGAPTRFGAANEDRNGRKSEVVVEGEKGVLPPSPPLTPPALALAFPVDGARPTEENGQAPPAARWERSPSAGRTSSSSSPPLSPTRTGPSFSSSPPRRMAARSSLPSLRTQLAGGTASTASSPSVLPPRSPRQAKASLPPLALLSIPISSPARSTSKKPRSRSRSGRVSPSSASSSGSSTPPSPVRPRSPTKPQATRKGFQTAVALGAPPGLDPPRGRSKTPRRLGDDSGLRRAPGSSFSSSSTHTHGYTAPAWGSSSLPPPPRKPQPLAAPLPPTPPHSPPEPLAHSRFPGDAEEVAADERFQSLPLLRLRHAISLATSLASYQAASPPTLRSTSSAPALRDAKDDGGQKRSNTLAIPALPLPLAPPSLLLAVGQYSTSATTSFATASAPAPSGRGAWHREQYRLYALGRSKALRTGGLGYWEGQGFELE